jgi:hypothetical protein
MNEAKKPARISRARGAVSANPFNNGIATALRASQ